MFDSPRSVLPQLLALALLLGSPASAVDSQPEATTEITATSPEEADPAIAELEQQWAELTAERQYVLALDEDAREARGDDRVALEAAALEKRLGLVDRLRAMTTGLQEFEGNEADVALYRGEILTLLPKMSGAIQRLYDATQEGIRKLQAEREKAAADAAMDLVHRILFKERMLERILTAGLQQTEMLSAFGLPSEAERKWLGEELSARARLLSGRMYLATSRMEELGARGDTVKDPAAVEAKLQAEQSSLEINSEFLGSIVALMEELEMDASQYKQLLIASTGEITTDVLDSQVASQLATRWVTGVRESVAENGPRVAFQTLLFILVLAVFWVLAKFVRNVTTRAVEAPHLRFSQLLKRMIVSLASGSVLIIGLLVALSQLGIQVGPMLAGLGIAGFIVGFALQDSLANFAAGVMILAYRPYDVQDLIECAGGVFGKVSHMNLVSTTILTIDNQTRVVPNGKIWGDVITNVTAQAIRRVDLVFGISYGDDIPKAEKVLEAIIEEHPMVRDEPEPVVKVHELGDSSVNFVVRPWVARDDYWDVHWDITREVKLRFDREGISIPFPQRDVHFHRVTEQAT